MYTPCLFLSHILTALEQFEKDIDSRGENKVDIGKIVWNVSDALRYTVLFPTEEYTCGVKNILDHLTSRQENSKIKLVKMKNFWGERNGSQRYQGINDVFAMQWSESPCGQLLVEVQFHTKESFDHKMTTHGMYEEFRSTHDPDRKIELWRESVRLAHQIPVPEQVLLIPSLKSHPMPIEEKLYADLLLQRAVHIQPKAVAVVEKLIFELSQHLGIGGHRIKAEYRPRYLSIHALQMRLQSELASGEKSKSNGGGDGGEGGVGFHDRYSLKDAALRIGDALIIAIIIPFEDYTKACEILLSHIFEKQHEFKEEIKFDKIINAWTSPTCLERSGPVGGAGILCSAHMKGDDDGVLFTPNDAYPLMITFQTNESVRVRIGIQAAWSEYRASNTSGQRNQALNRARTLARSVKVPPGALTILTHKDMEKKKVDIGMNESVMITDQHVQGQEPGDNLSKFLSLSLPYFNMTQKKNSTIVFLFLCFCVLFLIVRVCLSCGAFFGFLNI